MYGTLDSPFTGFDDIFSFFRFRFNRNLIADSVSLDRNSQDQHISEEIGLSIICQICKKNIVHLDAYPKKRKRASNEPIISSMKLCERCKNLSPRKLAESTKVARDSLRSKPTSQYREKMSSQA